MPHIKVQMFSGRPEEKKQKLAAAIAKDVTSILGVNDSSVSISIEDIDEDKWDDIVYDNEIVKNKDKLYKKPGYGSLSKTK